MRGEEKNGALLVRYVDGDLDPSDAEAVSRLLAAHPGYGAAVFELAEERLALEAVLRTPGTVQPRVVRGDAVRRPAAGPRPIVSLWGSRVRPWGWWVTGLAASVLVVFGLIFRSRLPQIRSFEAWDTVSVQRVVHEGEVFSDGTWLPAAAGQHLRPGAGVRTAGDGSEMVLEYADRTLLRLGARTEVRLEAAAQAGGRQLFVTRGVVTATVAPRSGVVAMQMSTPHAEIRVMGTRFVASVEPESTRVDVVRGEVQVRSLMTNRAVHLRAGQYVVAGREGLRSAQARSGPEMRSAQPPHRGAALLALYTFREGAGTIVRDLGGAGDPLDLTISEIGPAQWIPGGGLRVVQPALVASPAPATKIIRACQLSRELTIEAWIRPQAAAQDGPARIVALTESIHWNNFMLGTRAEVPGGWRNGYVFRLRVTQRADVLANPVSLPDMVTTKLTHLVVTRERSGRVRMYVDGNESTGGHVTYAGDLFTPARAVRAEGDFSPWRNTCRLTLANTTSRDRPWLGEYYLVAIYSRALSAEEVRRCLEAGLPWRKGLSSAVF